ncbi:MAG TPA: hypothetical protein VFW19_03125 [Allosphingosinicella sp.]|nr:hypothetical protein [Allosphingosinicella sp.]
MSRRLKIAGLALMLAVSARADAAGWELAPAAGGHGAVLTHGAGGPLSYRFECAADAVVVTETGVARLLDVRTGNKIGDDARGVMPPGAAMMALFTGKGQPDFRPAEAAKNPAGGWDLTIRLPKGDKALKAAARSDMISLFTTGETAAIQMDADAHAKWNQFLRSCSAGG